MKQRKFDDIVSVKVPSTEKNRLLGIDSTKTLSLLVRDAIALYIQSKTA